MTFMEWLHDQATRDVTRDQPFAGLYEIGPWLLEVLGSDEPKVRTVKAALDEYLDDSAAVAKLLGQLVDAMALWKTDTLLGALPADTAVAAGDTIKAKSKAVEIVEAKAMTGVLPPIMCGYRSLTGAECGNVAVPGSVRCHRHGGAITDPEVRSSLLLLAYAKLVEHTDIAVDALIDVAVNSRTDMARVQAAKELLDRAGIVQDQHIHVHGADGDDGETGRADLIERLRRELDSTKDRLRLVAIPAHSEEVTAEVAG